jgi:hypothetical protein
MWRDGFGASHKESLGYDAQLALPRTDRGLVSNSLPMAANGPRSVIPVAVLKRMRVVLKAVKGSV